MLRANAAPVIKYIKERIVAVVFWVSTTPSLSAWCIYLTRNVRMVKLAV